MVDNHVPSTTVAWTRAGVGAEKAPRSEHGVDAAPRCGPIWTFWVMARRSAFLHSTTITRDVATRCCCQWRASWNLMCQRKRVRWRPS